MRALQIWDNYELIKTIGEGGTGIVYQARQLSFERDVAIKVLNASLPADDLALKRFQQEAKIASSLDHPNIAKIYSYGIADSGPYLVMEFVNGRTLAAELEGNGPLSTEKFIQILGQVCAALAHAHSHGIVHRDIKPANIMLLGDPPNCTVKVLDFGIAKFFDQEKSAGLTSTGSLLGTPAYMSPEQCMGKEIDSRSDIYSLGCVMFHALSGQLPFSAATTMELMMQKTMQPAKTFAEINPYLKVSPLLANLIASCLNIDPANRPATVAEIAASIASAADDICIESRLLGNKNCRGSYKHFLFPAIVCALLLLPLFVFFFSGAQKMATRKTESNYPVEANLNTAIREMQDGRHSWELNDPKKSGEHMRRAKKIFQEIIGRSKNWAPLFSEKKSAAILTRTYAGLAQVLDSLNEKTEYYIDCIRKCIELAPKGFGVNSEEELRARICLCNHLSSSSIHLDEAESCARELLSERQALYNAVNESADGATMLDAIRSEIQTAEFKLGESFALLGFIEMQNKRFLQSESDLLSAMEILERHEQNQSLLTLLALYGLAFDYEAMHQLKPEERYLEALFLYLKSGGEQTRTAEAKKALSDVLQLFERNKNLRHKPLTEGLSSTVRKIFGTDSLEAKRAVALATEKHRAL